MAKKLILERIRSVSLRRRLQRTLDGVLRGAFWGAIVAVLLMTGRLFGYGLDPAAWLQVVLAVSTAAVLGAVVGCAWRVCPSDSARIIDQHYGLKDRILTALAFFRHADAGTVERLQIADAAEHVRDFDAKQVSPYRVSPRRVLRAAAPLLLAFAMTFVPPLRLPVEEAIAAPAPEVLAVADQLKEELVEPLEELAEEHPDEPEIEELSREMQELLEELEEANVDPIEVLVKLSEMEAALETAMAAYQLEAMDASLSELGESLSAAEATSEAAEALKEGDYDKAAKALEKMDASSMSRSERRAVSKDLAETANAMRLRKQRKAAEAVEGMAEGVSNGDKKKCDAAAVQIAGMCRKQGLRKGICQGLGCKLALLGMCKSQCAGACQGNKNGGTCNSWSDSSTENWGRGSTGEAQNGDPTELEGSRQTQQLTGMHGDGPSEVETLQSESGAEEVSRRKYQEVYKEYQQQSEAVLDSEPIPLGHRQMIRRYFESIRPDGEEEL